MNKLLKNDEILAVLHAFFDKDNKKDESLTA